jgi:hypothetical protein
MSGYRILIGISVFILGFSVTVPVFATTTSNPFFDNFDSYTSGNPLNGQGSWNKWSYESSHSVTTSGCHSGNCIEGGYGSGNWQWTGNATGAKVGSFSVWLNPTSRPGNPYWLGLSGTMGDNGSGGPNGYKVFAYIGGGSTNGTWAIRNAFLNPNDSSQDNIPVNAWHKVTVSWDLQTNNECNYTVALDNDPALSIAGGSGSPGNCYGYDTTYRSQGINGIYFLNTANPANIRIDDLGTGSVPISGNISSSTVWEAGTVYKISGILTVDSGKTLTINPGAVIKFDTATSSGIVVNGTLNANGVESDSKAVFFTSLKDDLIGGDTNSDASTTVAAAGDWEGITVNSGATANLSYSVIRYGGSSSGSNAMIYNNGGTLNIDDRSTVAYGSNYGIRNSSGTTTITSSDIGYNDYGLYFDGGSASVTASSTIQNNSSYGIYNLTTDVINAEGNYWGDSSGPYALFGNLGGLGNEVTSYVDFYPWIGTTTLRYVTVEIQPNCSVFNACWSVNGNRTLRLSPDATTSALYSSELNFATSTWNGLHKVTLELATSTVDLNISTVDFSDVNWKGGVTNGIPGDMQLNNYYLQNNSVNEVRNTFVHELGHALGLDHSYTGNVMYFAQLSQATLGPQDMSDYYYLWP